MEEKKQNEEIQSRKEYTFIDLVSYDDKTMEQTFKGKRVSIRKKNGSLIEDVRVERFATTPYHSPGRSITHFILDNGAEALLSQIESIEIL